MPTLSATTLDKLLELDATRSAPRVCAEIRRLLTQGSELDLYKLNAYRLASACGATIEETLRALLFATKLGIFDLNYDVYCPGCRGNTEYAKHLMGLTDDSHCNLCKVDFTVGFLEQVEVTFTVNPGACQIAVDDFSDRDNPGKVQWFEQIAKRVGRYPVLKAMFESPGLVRPMSTDHLAAGQYMLYVPREHEKMATLVVAGEATHELQRAAITVHADGTVEPGRLTFRPGPVELEVTSHYPLAYWPVLVYRTGAPSMWVSAAFVTSQQDFRDLFSGEYLSPAVSFGVKSTTLMFTDIRSSTELFEELGDSSAYALVQDHFVMMTEAIRARRGGIVKTIGDAVMAAFPANVDAVAAAVEIQRAFASTTVRGRRVELKIGLHRGPAITVTSNRNLDYFGRTVNMAARVQGRAGPGEVFFSDEVAADPAVGAYLETADASRDIVHASLKGIGDDVRLHRLRF